MEMIENVPTVGCLYRHRSKSTTFSFRTDLGLCLVVDVDYQETISTHSGYVDRYLVRHLCGGELRNSYYTTGSDSNGWSFWWEPVT